jgi:small subunit ribosomal protein S8
MLQDPISNMLTRIRNAQKAHHESVTFYASKFERSVLSLLKEEGYIASFSSEKDGSNDKKITVILKYYNGKPVISLLQRVSKPGLRVYNSFKDIKNVWGGLGIMIVSTSKGMMTDIKAKNEKLGGEIVCYVA